LPLHPPGRSGFHLLYRSGHRKMLVQRKEDMNVVRSASNLQGRTLKM
jgi:hypothetical protein